MKFWKRTNLLLFVCLALAAAAAPKKNILFILADDQRHDVLGCYGNNLIQTPTLDGLAENGVRFENFFCQTPICATSRATIMTGLSQRSHGFNFGELPVPSEYIPTSYPAYLKANGYRTGFAGKFGFRYAAKDKEQQFDFFKPYSLHPFLKKQPDGSLRHETDLCADAAIEFIKTNPKGQPFCMSVSFNATHADDADHRPGFHFQWPPSADGLYEDIEMPLPKLGDPKYFDALPEFLKDKEELSRLRYYWRWDTPEKYQTNLRAYYRLFTGIDNAVARILAELKTAGLDQNTIIVYTADNGYLMADRGLAGKWNHYDQSLHLPFIVYDPSLPKEKRGRVVKELCTHLDVAPTLVEWAGLPKPAVYQGESLAGLIEARPASDWGGDVFCEHKFNRYNNWHAVRGKKYKYAVYYDEPGGPYECLYDLEKDPAEFVNLADNPEYATVRKQMVLRLDTYLETYPLAKQKERKGNE
ncbi:Arylsulfatase [Pontiella desulfatans]|uniref:Arylsulfatase n=1 Tax=Pontiella desulfatans TaxID=2750659 RepID=A0A6C2TVX3_PONDE|nr:sulfatase [Pontiella desulfatans]SPS73600.1 sulfatase S1_25 [Kiritimatiellales bacterium]VGO11486.1 Arylsulfatase [Pontiella desulfatans]